MRAGPTLFGVLWRVSTFIDFVIDTDVLISVLISDGPC